MKIFKTEIDMFWKKQKQHATAHWTDKPASVIAAAITNCQRKFAAVMSKWFSKMDTKEQRSTVIVCFLMSIILCAAIVMQSIVNDLNSDPVMKVVHPPVRPQEKKTATVSEDIFNAIQNYKAYMDSNKLTIPPSMLDSINMIELIYHSQK